MSKIKYCSFYCVLIGSLLFAINSYADQIVWIDFGFHSNRCTDGSYDYSAWINVCGIVAEEVDSRGILTTPQKSFRLRKPDDGNCLELDNSYFENSYAALENAFPVGNYQLLLKNSQSMLKLFFNSDGPQVPLEYPQITSPVDSETEVGLMPTIVTQGLSDWCWLRIVKERNWEEVFQCEGLANEVSSVTIPNGILGPYEWYVVEIGMNAPEGYNVNVGYQVLFRTGGQ